MKKKKAFWQKFAFSNVLSKQSQNSTVQCIGKLSDGTAVSVEL